MGRDVLICTVGTSLKAVLGRQEPEAAELRGAVEASNPQATAQALLAMDPADRRCGAEINSVNSIVRSGHLTGRSHLFLLVSDTEDGRYVGKSLELYFRNRRCPLHFAEVGMKALEGLDDADPRAFRTQGLRSLVRECGAIIKEFGADRVAINATGGYKAQISFAGLIGQALNVPVYYMFERFPDVVELPPQPVTLDFDIWLENYELLRFLEERGDVTPQELGEEELSIPERLEVLVDRVEGDGELLALSPVGELFHAMYRDRFHQAKERLLPPPVPQGRRRHPDGDSRVWNEHTDLVRKDTLLAFLRRVFEETPYIRRFYALYTNPDRPKRTQFRVSSGQHRPYVVLEYSDRGACVCFKVELDTEDRLTLQAVAVDLNERFIAP